MDPFISQEPPGELAVTPTEVLPREEPSSKVLGGIIVWGVIIASFATILSYNGTRKPAPKPTPSHTTSSVPVDKDYIKNLVAQEVKKDRIARYSLPAPESVASPPGYSNLPAPYKPIEQAKPITPKVIEPSASQIATRRTEAANACDKEAWEFQNTASPEEVEAKLNYMTARCSEIRNGRGGY